MTSCLRKRPEDASFRNMALMKFDAARAKRIVEELGDPRFAGPAGEIRVADYVEEQFEKLGFTIERHEVEGSRVPGRVAPWLGWLGYGGLITAAHAMLLQPKPGFGVLAIFMVMLAHTWLTFFLLNRIRYGRSMARRESAALLIGRPTADFSPSVRVVFQAVLGGLETDLFPLLGLNRPWAMRTLYVCFLVTTMFASVAKLGGRAPVASVVLVSINTGFVVVIWLAILSILGRELRLSRSENGSHHADGLGLALLLEMARGWSRTRSMPIEAVFVAAGGQRLDYAGSREVVRLLQSEWPAKPSLLLLFFAPGAGGERRVFPIVSLARPGMDELVKDVARSLWIPIKSFADPWSHFQLWPFERKFRAAQVVVFTGSGSPPAADASVDTHVLEHAAQLATEIALRWARKQQSADS